MKKYNYYIVLIISFMTTSITIMGQNYNSMKCDSLIEIFEKSNGKVEDTTLYFYTKKICEYSPDFDTILKYAEISFRIADRINNDRYRGATKLRLGLTYKKLGDLKQAYIEIEEAMKYYRKGDSERGLLEAYSKLALILAAQKEYKQAITYTKESLVIYKKLSDSIRYATTSLNIGELYRLSKKYKEAKKYSIEALYIFKEKKYKTGVGYAVGNIGLIYLAQDSLQKAIINLNQSIAILEPLGDNYSTSVYYEGLAQVYQKQKKYKQALIPAKKSLLLAEKDGLIEQIRDANLRFSEIYSDTKQYKQAHEYYLQYIIFRDSLVNEKNIREIANMRRQYEVAQKQAEVDELTKTQKYLLTIEISLAIIVVLLVAFVFILNKYYRRKKVANKKLEKQQKELEKLNRTKDKFFSIISHDLRSPVATFQGFLELIDTMLTKGNIENIRRLFNDVRQSTKYVLDLMDNLLNWALSQKGEIPFSPQPCIVKNCMDEVLTVFSKTADAKGVSLQADIGDDLEVFVDQRMFQSIIRNLITNALKFTLKGGSIWISGSKSDKFVTLVVEDTGIGMSEEKVKTLFNLEVNKSTYGTQNEKGMGLGLRLVSEFVEKNDGKIYVESTEGKGTKMYVELPASEKGIEIPAPEMLLEEPVSKD